MSLYGDVFREAARTIDAGEEKFSCIAVIAAGHRFMSVRGAQEAHDMYDTMFRKHASRELYIIDFELENRVTIPYEQARAHRVLALCMAAAMADAGDLDEA